MHVNSNGRARGAWLFGLIAQTLAATSAADEGAAADKLSHYERTTVRAVVEKLGTRVVAAPEGKRVESIEVQALPVVEPRRDPIPDVLGLPTLLDTVHQTSRPEVIRRAVLLRPGQAFRQSLLDETCRNLRSARQLSLVLCLAVEGSTEGAVRILIVTKDVWSLRAGWDLRFANGRLEHLVVAPEEMNVAGSHQSVSALLELDPAAYSIGAVYTVPRIADSWISAAASVHLVVNRDSGATEGSFGSLAYGQPLFSTQTKWAWDGSMNWNQGIHRRFIGATVAMFVDPSEPGSAGIPYVYRQDILGGEYGVVRSFGQVDKNDLRFAFQVDRRVYRTLDTLGADPHVVASFRDTAIPTGDTKLGPYVQWHSYSTRFARLLDLNTLGLQEDYRVGYESFVRVFPSFRALGATRDTLGVYGSAAFTTSLGDGIARAFVESSTDFDLGGIADGLIAAGARVATPRLPFGRVVFDAIVVDRYRNYMNRQNALGGDTRLRGYPSQAFLGRDLVALNLELRSRPIELFTAQLGAAAFFDAGDAFDGWDSLCLKQGAGVGLRGLLPMLDRIVTRLDWGFPLQRGPHSCYPEAIPQHGFPGEILLTFRQAVPMPVIPAVVAGLRE